MSTKSLSPLFLNGWICFNSQKWGLEAEAVNLHSDGKELPAVSAIFFFGRNGQLKHPPLNPYLSIDFQSTSTTANHRVEFQWLSICERLGSEMLRRGLTTIIPLPPVVVDVRPWQYLHFDVGVKYTYFIDFPYHLSGADQSVRRNVSVAEKLGYRCVRTTDMAHVEECLRGTAERQKFPLQLSRDDLRLAQRLIGEENFRAYVAYAPNGEPASAKILLHRAGGRALAWLAGTKANQLQSGVNQILNWHVLQELEQIGAAGIDMVGANLATVAVAKAKWGGKLVPYFTLHPTGVKGVLQSLSRSMHLLQSPLGGLVRGVKH